MCLRHLFVFAYIFKSDHINQGFCLLHTIRIA